MLLPLHASLPDGKNVIVNYVTESRDDVTTPDQMYVMIRESALAGDGYGVDEFPTEEDFRKEISDGNGKVFHVVCESDDESESGSGNEILAAFAIVDSRYYRGKGTVADSYIVVRRRVRRKGIGELCMTLVVELARRMGYSAIYSDTFQDNIAMRKIVEMCGFRKVGILPMSARMPDGSVKPSVVYYRELLGEESEQHGRQYEQQHEKRKQNMLIGLPENQHNGDRRCSKKEDDEEEKQHQQCKQYEQQKQQKQHQSENLRQRSNNSASLQEQASENVRKLHLSATQQPPQDTEEATRKRNPSLTEQDSRHEDWKKNVSESLSQPELSLDPDSTKPNNSSVTQRSRVSRKTSVCSVPEDESKVLRQLSNLSNQESEGLELLNISSV